MINPAEFEALNCRQGLDTCILAIVSSNGVAEYSCLSPVLKELPGMAWIKHGDSVPATSSTSRFQKDPQNVISGRRVEGYTMLDEWLDGAPRIEMQEDVVGLGHYGKTLTVLFTDAEVEPEGSEEEEDSFDRWQRWEKRR